MGAFRYIPSYYYRLVSGHCRTCTHHVVIRRVSLMNSTHRCFLNQCGFNILISRRNYAASFYPNSVSEIVSQFQEKFLTPQSTGQQDADTSWPSSLKGWTTAGRMQHVLSDAEKVVGYPASLFGLKCLLTNEGSTIAGLIHRLVGTNHPLLETAKFILNNGRCTPQTHGLIVLLLSKAAGLPSNVNTNSNSARDSGPLPKQRILAEIAETIHTVFLIHGGLINLKFRSTLPQDEDLQLGNRIATLVGDYLLAASCNGLASLRCPQVVEEISKAIGNFSEGEFIGHKNKQGRPVPYPGISIADWEERTFTSGGSLLAHSCQSALVLADHSETLQQRAFELGKWIGFAWQAYADLQIYSDATYQPSHTTFDLTSMPLVLHLEHDEQMMHYIQSHIDSTELLDFHELYHIVSKSESISKAKEILHGYIDKAVEQVSHFKSSDATKALLNIIGALR